MSQIPVAREGWLFIIPAGILTAAALLIQWYIAALILGFITASLIHFFRDPERSSGAPAQEVLSPADGTIIQIKETTESEGFTTQVSIMMSMFDVQVNRAPIGGTITSVQRLFPSTDHEDSAEEKEAPLTIIEDRAGRRVAVRQFAGLLARPVVDRRKGDIVARGERIGMIKFGSRVDLLLPVSAEVLVQRGEKVKVGLTPMARFEGAE